MKLEPEYQGQHVVPQVYLKQFGFMENDEWLLSVCEVGKTKTEIVKIVDFTKKTNIFDLPFSDPELKRHFENKSNEVENRFRTILSNLDNQKRIIEKDKYYLTYFVANILCRTNPFRCFVESLLNNSDTEAKFIREITMFSNNPETTKELLETVRKDFKLNVAICTLMEHLAHVFSFFEMVVLKDMSGKGWLTTDRPVYLDKKDKYEWIIPVESELYFPLSKDYFLFMYLPNSPIQDNELRKLKVNKVNPVDFEFFDALNKKLLTNHVYKYLIMNSKINPHRLNL
jgi:hypothetical protein